MIEKTQDASLWYRLWSNQAHLLAIVTYAQMALPFWDGVIPAAWFGIAGAVLNSSGIFLRGIRQKNLRRKVREGADHAE